MPLYQIRIYKKTKRGLKLTNTITSKEAEKLYWKQREEEEKNIKQKNKGRRSGLSDHNLKRLNELYPIESKPIDVYY